MLVHLGLAGSVGRQGRVLGWVCLWIGGPALSLLPAGVHTLITAPPPLKVSAPQEGGEMLRLLSPTQSFEVNFYSRVKLLIIP